MPVIQKPADAIAELVEHRTLHAKRFAMADGTHKILHTIGRVHFQDDDGQLKDIETDLSVEDGTGDIVAASLPFRFRLLKTGVGYLYQSRSGGTIRVELRRVGGTAIDTAATFAFTRDKNRITFANVATGLDIVIQVNRGGLQIFRVLKSANAAKSWRWVVIYDVAGQSKIGTTIEGKDAGNRKLAGLTLANGSATDNGNGTSTYLCNETWDGTVVTRDPVTRIPSITSDPQYPVTIDPDVSEEIPANRDDSQERAGSWNYHYTAVGWTGGGGGAPTNTGLRFTTVAVANGATISLAEIKLKVTGKAYGAYGGGTLYGVDEDNAAGLDGGSRKPSALTKTSASASLPAPTSTGIKAYDVTSIVQEIVNRAGWASGNSMAFVAIGTGTTNGETNFEDFANAGTDEALLEITLAGAGPSGVTSLIGCGVGSGAFLIGS